MGLNPHPFEAGAGIGLIAFCIAMMLVDNTFSPIALLLISLGLLLSTGILSQKEKKAFKKCKKDSSIINHQE